MEDCISKETIMFVGGGIETVPAIKIAKEMNLNVIVSDANEEAQCAKLADYFIQSSVYDYDKTLGEIKKYVEKFSTLNGVICVATDAPYTVSKISNYFNLPGISLHSAKLASDKLAMKNALKKGKLPIPWYQEIKSYENLKKIVDDYKFPLVIKPVDSRGARGVLKLTEDVDLNWAYNTALQASPSKRIMIEKFMPGPQISTESIIINGVSHTIGFADRNYELLEQYFPYFIENGGQLPCLLDSKSESELNKLIEAAAKSLNIKNGIIKGDIVITNDKPQIIEVAARLSGGYFCTHEIPLNTGVNFVKLAIKQCLNHKISPLELQKKFNKPVAQRFLFCKPGIIKSIKISEWINNDPNVHLLDIRIKKGDIIKNITSHPSRSGVVITTGDSLEEALTKAEAVLSDINVVME